MGCCCDCYYEYAEHKFVFLDKNTGKNLFFGPDAKYDYLNLGIFTLTPNNEPLPLGNFYPMELDSSIVINFTGEHSRQFIRFEAAEIDTIDLITHIVGEGGCCEYRVIDSIYWNNKILKGSNQKYIVRR
jgi:hypothetical protein